MREKLKFVLLAAAAILGVLLALGETFGVAAATWYVSSQAAAHGWAAIVGSWQFVLWIVLAVLWLVMYAAAVWLDAGSWLFARKIWWFVTIACVVIFASSFLREWMLGVMYDAMNGSIFIPETEVGQ